ncbi:unnamed protein product [Peronospora effusa]|nr:unnamed protein product [Peronospora effusa]
MYEVLATHFEVDDLARILVKGAESDVGEEMNGRARSLLDFQVFMWNTLGRDEANVFKLLQLDTTKKPLESPVFSKWAKFVWLRYPKENPDKMILDKLSSIYKSKNALLGGLDTLDRAKASSQDKAAEKILEYQYKQWSNKDAKEVFDILELHRSDSNLFKTPAFSAWVGFVSSISSDGLKAFKTILSFLGLDYKDNLETILSLLELVYKNKPKTMLSILELVYKDNLVKALDDGTKIKKVKPVAENLLAALKRKKETEAKKENRLAKRNNSYLQERPPAKRQNSKRPLAIGQNSKRPPGLASSSKTASDLVPDPAPASASASDPVPASASDPVPASASDPVLAPDPATDSAPAPAPVAKWPIIDLNKLPNERH